MKVALTGGATGIGAEVAAKMKQRGATVTAFDLNEPQANVDRWVRIDLADPSSIESALGQANDRYDCLINNAGLPPREGAEELVLKVNYFGLQQFMDGMLEKITPGGTVVNTASRAGAMWRENIEQVKALMALQSADDLPAFIKANDIDPVRAYNLSKEAVIVLTQTMTERLIGMDLRINSVSPAAVSTGILDDFVAAFGPKVGKAIARAGRAGNPDEVANVICFLASPESNWIKGQDITIDGGLSAMMLSDSLSG